MKAKKPIQIRPECLATTTNVFTKIFKKQNPTRSHISDHLDAVFLSGWNYVQDALFGTGKFSDPGLFRFRVSIYAK